jgi:hypothetical protein
MYEIELHDARHPLVRCAKFPRNHRSKPHAANDPSLSRTEIHSRDLEQWTRLIAGLSTHGKPHSQ